MILSAILFGLVLQTDQQLLPVERYLPRVGEYRPYVSVGTGLQYNFPTPIIIRQAGQPDIRLTARFSTRPFFEVPYYDVKVGVTRKLWNSPPVTTAIGTPA